MIYFNVKLYTITAFIIIASAMGSHADNTAPDVIATPLTWAAWELRMLGVTDEDKLQLLRRAASKRPVRIAVVGLGGVSRAKMAAALTEGNTLEYCNGVTDPGKGTHDTHQLHIMSELTAKLGFRIHWLIYHPKTDADIGEAFDAAGKTADLVLCFHSFWGENVPAMADKIRPNGSALYLLPYAEYQGLPTGSCPQAFAANPNGGGIPHLVTCSPLSRKTAGRLIHPLCRNGNDSETINFIAPSYYADNSGGSCLATGITTAVAAYIVAASPEKPTPAQILILMRHSAIIDRQLLTSVPEFNDAAVDKFQSEVDFLTRPDKLGIRRLDAPGLINLWHVFKSIQNHK